MQVYSAQKFIDDKFILGEGPAYDERYDRFSWVDIKAKTLYTLNLATGERTEFKTDELLGAALPLARSDGFILAQETGLFVLEDGERSMFLPTVGLYEDFQRSNDAKTDPQGRIWFGSTSEIADNQCGNLFCLDCRWGGGDAEGAEIVTDGTKYEGGGAAEAEDGAPDEAECADAQDLQDALAVQDAQTGDSAPIFDYEDEFIHFAQSHHVSVKQPDTKLSNGMAWSGNHDRFYFSDSLEHAVFVYDYDEKSGEISNRRVLFELPGEIPDGMTIDRDDNLWVAIWGGSRVECRSGKTGELLAVINVAATNVTSCCFGGKDYKTLFITTSGEGFEEKEGRFDGRIFTCETGAQGLPADLAEI